MAHTLPASRPLLRPARRFIALSLAPLLAISLAGCDVRLETPPHAEREPDAVELVRAAAADDAAHIADQAYLSANLSSNSFFADQLSRVHDEAAAHLAALGGIYVSGLDDDDAAAGPDAAAEGASDGAVYSGPAAFVNTLNQAAARNLNAANVDANGDKARLLASIGVSQALAAHRIHLLNVPEGETWSDDYDPVAELVLAGWTGGTHDGVIDEVAELGEPAGDEATGLTVADFQAIVQSEDAARYAFEVAAARTEGDARAAFRQRARVHGARAQAWAVLGLIAETDQDPRLVAYQVPIDMPMAELVLSIEQGLSNRWAALIAAAAPGTRGPLIEAFLASQLSVELWGGGIATFPGMPELAGQFGAPVTPPDQPRIPYEWAAGLPEEEPTGPHE